MRLANGSIAKEVTERRPLSSRVASSFSSAESMGQLAKHWFYFGDTIDLVSRRAQTTHDPPCVNCIDYIPVRLLHTTLYQNAWIGTQSNAKRKRCSVQKPNERETKIVKWMEIKCVNYYTRMAFSTLFRRSISLRIARLKPCKNKIETHTGISFVIQCGRFALQVA